MGVALFPLRQKGVHVMNYHNDWLVGPVRTQALFISHLECLSALNGIPEIAGSNGGLPLCGFV